MSEQAIILYGQKAPRDQIIEDRGDLMLRLRARGIDLALATTGDQPHPGDILPGVQICDKPEFQNNGDLLPGAAFRAGWLTEAAVVYDRWSENYNRSDHPATGIGRADSINHFPVQNLGRSKRAMGEAVLGPLGIGIPAYTTTEAREFLARNPGKKIFAKPDNGSLGQGARAISDTAELSKLNPDDILQEFCDTTARLAYLKPYTAADRGALEAVNQNGSEKELRMYTFFSTRADGSVHKDYWPILRTRAPHQGQIKADSIIRTRIDPESVPPTYYRLAGACGDKIMQITGVKHLYIALDLAQARTQEGEEKVAAIELNSRFPGLWKYAEGAREMFADQARIIADAAGR